MSQEFYIQRCIQIAKNGLGTTAPNPSVGAVIVFKDKIIGEGFTSAYGGSHAEVNAIAAVKEKKLLKQATLYVSLEPCSHFGKTPPCADLIVQHQIPKVVIGCVDSNSLVAGKGIARLRKAGIHVTVGVLEAACKEHHKRFFTVQLKKRPYIVLKWATTKDGYIAPESKKIHKPVWISNLFSQQLAHKIRSFEQAILVGTETVIADNPTLNIRNWAGEHPVRIVLDRTLRIPADATVFDGAVKTIVITANKTVPKNSRENIIYESIEFPHLQDEESDFAQTICNVLQKHSIQSVLIEGGGQTLQTFINAKLWDEAYVFVGDHVFGSGTKAPIFNSNIESEIRIQNDLLKKYNND